MKTYVDNLIEQDLFNKKNHSKLYLTIESTKDINFFKYSSLSALLMWAIIFKNFYPDQFISENFFSMFYWPLYLLAPYHLYLKFEFRKYYFKLNFYEDALEITKQDFTSASCKRRLRTKNISISCDEHKMIFNDADTKVMLPFKYSIYVIREGKRAEKITPIEILKTIKAHVPNEVLNFSR